MALGRIRIQTKNRRRNERCFSYLNQSTLPYSISSSGIFTRPNKQTPRICLCPSPPHTSHAPPVQHPRWPASVACITCLDLQVRFPTRPAPQLQHSDPIPSPSLRTRRYILPFIDMHWNLEFRLGKFQVQVNRVARDRPHRCKCAFDQVAVSRSRGILRRYLGSALSLCRLTHVGDAHCCCHRLFVFGLSIRWVYRASLLQWSILASPGAGGKKG